MIPGALTLLLYRGDTFFGPIIVLPDLSPFGGPQDLTGAEAKAQLRRQARDVEATEPTVEVLDAAARRLRLTLPADETATLPSAGVWDLQVVSGDWVGTVLAGPFEVRGEATR